jgi:hypothetical protein
VVLFLYIEPAVALRLFTLYILLSQVITTVLNSPLAESFSSASFSL